MEEGTIYYYVYVSKLYWVVTLSLGGQERFLRKLLFVSMFSVSEAISYFLWLTSS